MMGKYYKIIVLVIFSFFLFASNSYAVSPVIRMSGGDSSTCDTSNIVFWWRCETTTLDATNDYSSASGTPTISSIDVATDAVKYGSKGLDVADAWSYLYYATPSAALDDEFRVGFWIYINSWGNNAGIVRITAAAGDNTTKLIFGTGDELSWQWRDNASQRSTVTTVDANLATSTWYWIELAAKTSTNYREILVGGVQKAISSDAISSFAFTPLLLYFGDFEGVSVDYYIDNVIISTDSTADLFTDCKDELEWPE